MSLFKSHPLVLALCTAGLLQPVFAATQITPNLVTVGKETSISISSDDAEIITHAYLTPGGPILKQRIEINMAATDLMAHFEIGDHIFNGVLFQAEADNGLAIYPSGDKSRTPIRYLTTGPALDLAIDDQYVYIANGDNGLTLLDISTPKQPRWVSSHQKLGNVIRVVAKEQRALVLNDAGVLFFISTENPVEPTTLGSYRGNGEIKDIALNGELGLIKTEQHIDSIDFSFHTPLISNEGLDFGQGVNFGGERRAFIKDSIAYVADWFSGIHIYDISRPASPNLLSSYHTPGSPKGIVVRNGIAYVADDDHGLQILDVRDPRNPKQISTLLTNGLAYTPKLVGNLLFLASHRGGFQIIDIKNPQRPQLISGTDTPGKAWSIEIKNQLAYVADDDSGLLIYDVHNPALPALIGQYQTGAAAEEIIVRDNLAYVAFFDDGLHILDISNPRQPVQLSHTAIPGNARGLDLVDDTLYVASWLAGVHILDISNVIQPRIIGRYDTRGATWGLKAKENFLYIMDWWGGFAVLDISRPERPTQASSYHHRGRVNDIAAQDNYAFVAQGSNGLQVFDIKNPLNPTWTTGVSFAGQATRVVLKNDHAYVAAGSAGLAVIDISNPFNIRWLGNYDSKGNAIDIITTDDSAVVLNNDGSLTSFDLSNPTKPHRRDQLPLGATAIGSDNPYLYVATASALQRYRLDNGQLNKITDIPLDFPAEQLAIKNDLLAASHGKQAVLYRISTSTLEQLTVWSLDATIETVRFNADALYLGSNKEIVSIDNVASNTAIGARYQTLGRSGRLTPHNGILYSSGDETIRAIRQLPKTRLQTQSNAKYLLTLPAGLAAGSYSLVVEKNGLPETLANSLTVTMPHFSKPKLSLEAFKKLMEQKRSTDLFTQP